MFQSERTDYYRDYLTAYGDDYMRDKKYGGVLGDITYQWSGTTGNFRWKTDGSNKGREITAWVYFLPLSPEIENFRDDCGLVQFETENRLKIDLRYNKAEQQHYDDRIRCAIDLKLRSTRTLTLTIDDYSVSLISKIRLEEIEKP